MKQIGLLLFLLGMLINCNAQEQFLEFKAGPFSSILKFKDSGEDTGRQPIDAGGEHVSLAFSSQLYKNIYLKTSLSIAHSSNHINLDWHMDGVQRSVFGDIQTNTTSIDILPEYYFGKSRWLFINLGFGVDRFDYTHNSGWYRYGDNPIDLNDRLPNESGFMAHIIGGVGLKHNFKNLGIMAELSKTISSYSGRSLGQVDPGIGLSKVIGSIGISYQLFKSH